MAPSQKIEEDGVMKKRKSSSSVSHDPLWSLKWKFIDGSSFYACSDITKMRINSVIVLAVVVILFSGLSVGVFTAFPRFVLLFLTSVGIHPDGNSIFGLKYSKHSCPSNNVFLSSQSAINGESCDATSGNQHNSGRSKTSGFYDTSISIKYRQKLPIGNDIKKEAVAAMNVAIGLQERGKMDKAMKVFQHALALDPSHVDIITAFGEFLEMHVKDVVKADHMYQVALEHCPAHSRALQNRERTGPIVDEIDEFRFKRIDQKRALFYTIPTHHPGLRRAKKEAYFAHIYHTNAIEGNTLSLAQTRSIVETRMAVGGKSLHEQNEVLGLDAALSFINSTLVGRLGSLTLQDILNIHIRVLGYVDPTEAGRLRTNQVYVGDFKPPAANELKDLMQELLDWLNSEEASKLHPIEFAALAHYRLVIIHPFFDGNGRTSRLLMNLILMQAGFPPVSIEVNDRLKYYETLEQGNKGDIRPFIRFIARCAERTLDGYLSVTMDDYELSPPRHRNKGAEERVIYVDNEFYEDDYDVEFDKKDNDDS